MRDWIERWWIAIVAGVVVVGVVITGVLFPRPVQEKTAIAPATTEVAESADKEKIAELQRQNDKLETQLREGGLKTEIEVLKVQVAEREKDIDELREDIRDINQSSRNQPSDPPYYPTPQPGISSDRFTAAVYRGENFNEYVGSLAEESTINHYWGSRGPLGLSNHFSVRWEGQFKFQEGNYRFRMTADEGARLYIDNQLVIDFWGRAPGSKTGTEAGFRLNTGYHSIKVEYFDRTGQAVMRLNWQEIIP